MRRRSKPKNFDKYAIRCDTNEETSVAVKFVRLVTKLPYKHHWFYPRGYVGIYKPYREDVHHPKCVCVGTLDRREIPIQFKDIKNLADTPARVRALEKAIKKPQIIKPAEA